MYKKQILEVLFDSLLIVFCFSLSNFLKYDWPIDEDVWNYHDQIMVWLVCVKIATFYFLAYTMVFGNMLVYQM